MKSCISIVINLGRDLNSLSIYINLRKTLLTKLFLNYKCKFGGFLAITLDIWQCFLNKLNKIISQKIIYRLRA